MFMLDADIRNIIKYVADGTEFTINKKDYDSGTYPEKIIKSGSSFLDPSTSSDYPLACVCNDIAHKRISLGLVIAEAEKDPDFNMDFEDGKIYVYDTKLEKLKEEREHLSNDAIVIFRETMPKVLVDAGLGDTPTKVSAYVYDKVCANAVRGKRAAHHLDDETLIAIKYALDDPVAIIRSEDKDGNLRLAVVTRIPDKENHPILCILGRDNETGDNYISSMYGKEKISNYIVKQAREGNLMYLGDTEFLGNYLNREEINTVKSLYKEKKTLKDVENIIKEKKDFQQTKRNNQDNRL